MFHRDQAQEASYTPLIFAGIAFFFTLILRHIPVLRWLVYPFQLFVTLVHELSHALTWRLWDCADRLVLRHKPPEDHGDHRWWLEECHEEAVTTIALAFVNLKRELLDTEPSP